MDLAEAQKALEDAKAEIAAVKADAAKAKQPVTSNAAGLTGTAAEGKDFEVLGDVVARIDPLKGKGLLMARAALGLAIAEKTRKSFSEVEKQRHLPEGLISRVLESTVSKAMGEGTIAGGGAFAPDTVLAEFIEVLRPRLALLKAGVVDLPMNVQSVSIPRQSADISGAWVGENQNVSSSAITTDEIQLVLKKWGAVVPISNDQLRDNVIATDLVVRDSMLAQGNLALDLAMIRGAGTAYTPRGVRNWVPSTQLISANAGSGSNTLTTAAVDLATAQQLVETANVPVVKPALLMSPRSKWGYMQLRDGVGHFVFADEMRDGTLWGIPYFTTTQIPNNLSGGGSGGSAESELYFCETTQWLLGLGLSPSIEVERNGSYFDGTQVQAGMSLDQTVIRVILRADFVPRHPQAATVVQGLTIQ